MKFTNTLITAVVAGGLLAGIGATPAGAASGTTPRASASMSSARLAVGTPSANLARATTVHVPAGPIGPTAPVAPGAARAAGESRFLPVVIAAAARLFVAGARAVPGLLNVLKPFAKKGATAFFNAVKKYAPKAVSAIVTGAMGSALYEQIKRLLGW